MRMRVLKGFDYSTDGITSRHLVAGSEENIREDLVDGLRVEGYVAPTRATADAAPPVAAEPPAAETRSTEDDGAAEEGEAPDPPAAPAEKPKRGGRASK